VSEKTAPCFWGKYRGTVTGVDTKPTGRLQVQCPDVLGSGVSSWAMPCSPVAGRQMGVYAVPPVGSGVWVEFEQGNPDYPIWSGCYWSGESEVPSIVASSPSTTPPILLQTTNGHTLQLSDVSGPTGGILIKHSGGAQISITDSGIEITNGKGAKISLSGSSVSINDPALVVT
jgi:uncharacterized protein involved in type VI secretion and phage assembly